MGQVIIGLVTSALQRVTVVAGTNSKFGEKQPLFARRDIVGSNPTTLNKFYYHRRG